MTMKKISAVAGMVAAVAGLAAAVQKFRNAKQAETPA